MNTMIYKGYTTVIMYSSTDECLLGSLLGIDDIISFHGDSVSEVRQAFEDAVDEYLNSCIQTGKAPQKPFSGEITLQMPHELHARLARAAHIRDKSLGDFVAELLEQAVCCQFSSPITSPHKHP